MGRAQPQAMQRAIAAYGQGKWAEAEAWCQRVLDGHAGHFGALNLLGVIAAQTHRAQDAAEFFGRAVAANPTDAAALCNHGSILQSIGRLDEALASYDRALGRRPHWHQAQANRELADARRRMLEPTADGAEDTGQSDADEIVFDDRATILDNASIRDLGDLGRVFSPPKETPVAGRPLAR